MRQAKEWLHAFFILKLKPSMKKLFLSAMLAISATCVNAYDFEANGMYFNIVSLSDLTAELTRGDYTDVSADNMPTKRYSGDFVVPQTVEYSGRTFTPWLVLQAESFTSLGIRADFRPRSTPSFPPLS